MLEPPRQPNPTIEILHSLRRQEEGLASVRKMLMSIQLTLGGLFVLAVIELLSRVAQR